MKRLLITLLILALLPAVAAKSYNEGDSFNIEGERFNITGVSSTGEAVFFANQHGDFAISQGDCKDRDIYLLCVEEIDQDIVEYYPHEYQIEFTWDKLCTECFAWGQECKNNSEKVCQDACVHGICRPRDPWCGDGYCDAQENYQTCSADCEQPVNNETNTNQTNTSNQTQSADEQEQEQTSNESTTPQANTSAQSNDSQASTQAPQEPDGPAAQVVEDSPNWLGAAITIFGGIVLIFVIFNRKKHKDDEDLYSYK